MTRTARLFSLALVACLLAGCATEKAQEKGLINTAAVIADLSSAPWGRSVGPQGQFAQSMSFRPDGTGRMQRADLAPAADFTYRVDGAKLTVQYYIEVETPGNWRTRTRVYDYRFEGDSLLLNHMGQVETWRRVRAASGRG